jgi:hypothetical protein
MTTVTDLNATTRLAAFVRQLRLDPQHQAAVHYADLLVDLSERLEHAAVFAAAHQLPAPLTALADMTGSTP